MVLPVENPTKSYWIEAAASPLRNLPPAPELPETTDLVIVGSGYTGASAAYWIHKYTAEHGRTPQMVMLEARDICGAATGRNGGQLRPHAYSRYPAWSKRFGPDGALELIRHEMAHLDAFRALLDAEGIADEACLKIGETFDAAMTSEAWTRLRGAFDAFVADHGRDGEVIRLCRLIEDPAEAEAFTQMKGCIGAVVHPAGQVWPYKFVHALLRIVLATGNLQLHDQTPVSAVSGPDVDGLLTVTTPRGQVRARAVLHATNCWASHLLPEFGGLISPSLCTVAAIQAPAGFIRNTGAQHWDSTVNNYHNQLPPPYNVIVVGGAKAVCAHYPHAWLRSDDATKQLPGVPHFFKTWPSSDLVGWPGTAADNGENHQDPAETPLGLPDDEGGVWTGVEASSIDGFPFIGPAPSRPGQFVAAGFAGHGMPRILLSTAHITPLILAHLDLDSASAPPPSLVAPYPPLPAPFLLTEDRVRQLQDAKAQAQARAEYEDTVRAHELSAEKPFCNEPRCIAWKTET